MDKCLPSNCSMNLEQATAFLKKVNEWESVWRFDRDTIIGWANFLKSKEKKEQIKPSSVKKVLKSHGIS